MSAVTMTAGRKMLPRYVQIAKALTDAIIGGKYSVGAQLPTEAELCDQYRISRHTAREALRQLRESGLISRRRGAGTTVASATANSSFNQPISSIADLMQYAADTRLQIHGVDRVAADARLAQLLACRKGREWIRLEGTRVRPGAPLPVCVVTVYLNTDVAGIESKLARSSGAIYPLLEKQLGLRIAWIGQSIDAIALGAGDARRLAAEPGSPGLRIVRRYYDANERLLELSDSVHPGSRFTYTMKLQRE